MIALTTEAKQATADKISSILIASPPNFLYAIFLRIDTRTGRATANPFKIVYDFYDCTISFKYRNFLYYRYMKKSVLALIAEMKRHY